MCVKVQAQIRLSTTKATKYFKTCTNECRLVGYTDQTKRNLITRFIKHKIPKDSVVHEPPRRTLKTWAILRKQKPWLTIGNDRRYSGPLSDVMFDSDTFNSPANSLLTGVIDCWFWSLLVRSYAARLVHCFYGSLSKSLLTGETCDFWNVWYFTPMICFRVIATSG